MSSKFDLIPLDLLYLEGILLEDLRSETLQKIRNYAESLQESFNLQDRRASLALVRFLRDLQDGAIGVIWIEENIQKIVHSACSKSQEISSFMLPDEGVPDFEFSVVQFLQQAAHCLGTGSYEILNFPEIPLLSSPDHYKYVFRAIKNEVPLGMKTESILLIWDCLEHLIFKTNAYSA